MPGDRSVCAECELQQSAKAVLSLLLKDRSTNRNLLWGTDDYDGHRADDEITEEAITGAHEGLIQPRALKTDELQRSRSQNKAEVFTPSWVCNAQNNLIDWEWFGREGVFNVQHTNAQSWQTSSELIVFPEGKTWQDYVCLPRLEVSCGEAPYLTSRYDATTCQAIPVPERIGLLDRKLRICAENCRGRGSKQRWLTWSLNAVKCCYGFDWQGDNVLLARENILFAVMEAQAYYFPHFTPMTYAELKRLAEVVSWNIWQMDGLRGVVPGTCHEEVVARDLFDEHYGKRCPCPGCVRKSFGEHNGVKCLIKDWFVKDKYARPQPFYTLFASGKVRL